MNTLTKENIIGISALLVHAAKIDENYSDKEKMLIKNFPQISGGANMDFIYQCRPINQKMQ